MEGSGSVSSAAPPTYTISSITVEGIEDARTREFVVQTSGLQVGEQIQLTGSRAIPEAIRSIYDLGLFSDVQIHKGAQTAQGITLIISVQPEPTLALYRMTGIRDRHRDDLKEKLPLILGRPLRPSDVERSKQIIKSFYEDKGYLKTTVSAEQEERLNGNIELTFNVDRGEKVEVDEIIFSGNSVIDDGDLRDAMETNIENRWWRFWKGEKFKPEKLDEDKQKVIDLYRSKGYYDARIVSDSVYYTSNEDVNLRITVAEGDRYFVRNIEWTGNTIFPDRLLTQRLGLEEGAPYDGVQLEKNLYGNKRGTDIAGLYMDRGYMKFQPVPTIRVVEGDSLDITIAVREGDVYSFGDIQITGNTKTKDYVVRRELYTVPGRTFSRSAIQESIRRLMQLKYFSQKSLTQGPNISIDEKKKEVDLTYAVKETGSDQLQLSGTWGQFGVVLQLGFQFNNFSAQNLFNWDAWRPLPSGDGQKLSLNIRTNGSFYQNYSVSFTEPWFRGEPTPIGGSVSYSRYTRALFGTTASDGSFTNINTRLFLSRRLDWPDDKFMTSTALGYQFYNNRGGLFPSVPDGVSQTVTVQQSLSRSSIGNPRFPRSGSKFELSLEVAPPVGDLIQYHKWRFKTDWHIPMGEKFSLSIGSDFGYIGSLTGEDVNFERFEVGGTPFDYSGYSYGTEPIFMRGYPVRAIGPKRTLPNGQITPVGGRILNKYTTEFRFMALQNQQLQAAPYLFFDAANSWNSFKTFNPGQLYRSAGVGVRLYLPIVGMLEFNYGYNFDRYVPVESGDSGARDWGFQFTIGQGF